MAASSASFSRPPLTSERMENAQQSSSLSGSCSASVDMPHSGNNSRLRTVCLTGLPRGTAVYDILKQVQHGIVTHVTPNVAMGKGLKVQTVLITFLDARAAKDCIDHFQRTSVILSILSAENLAVAAHPHPMISAPIKPALHHLIATGTVTRILLLSNIDPAIQHLAIVENLRNTMLKTGSEHHDILAVEDMPCADHTNPKRIHFNSVKNAIRAFRAILSGPFFLGSIVVFAPDPCDPNGHIRLGGMLEMPAWVMDGSLPEGFHHRQHVSPLAEPVMECSDTVADGIDDVAEPMHSDLSWSRVDDEADCSEAMTSKNEVGRFPSMTRQDSVMMDNEELEGGRPTKDITSSGLLIEGLAEVTTSYQLDSTAATTPAEEQSLLD